MSPVFGHGRLRLYLLKLLEEEPRHGYDIIRALEDRFMGLYAPSAGTVYPRLARLEAEGLVSVTEEEGRKVYAITDAGREELRTRADELEDIEADIAGSVRELADSIRSDVRGSVRDLRAELKAAAREMRRTARHEARTVRQTWRTATDGTDGPDESWFDEGRRRAGPTIERILESFRAESDVWSRAAVAAGAVSREAVSKIDRILDEAVTEVRRVVAEARAEQAGHAERTGEAEGAGGEPGNRPEGGEGPDRAIEPGERPPSG